MSHASPPLVHSGKQTISLSKRLGYIGLIPVASFTLLIGLLWLLRAMPSLAQTAPTAIRYASANGSMTSGCTQVAPCTLQRAANLSVNGDEVRVQAGTYFTTTSNPVLQISQNVWVHGGYDQNWNGPDPDVNQTILDGQSGRRVIFVVAGASPTIEGFYITNGLANQGGGVYDGGTATIQNNVIYNNSADLGAGIAIYNSGGTASSIRFNRIYQNTAGNVGVGGGVYIHSNATAFLEGNTIHNNSAAQFGGGVGSFLPSTFTLQSNQFYANSASHGAGVQVYGNGQIWNNTFAGNSASSDGGGVYVETNSNVNISNNIIAFNNGGATGDGLFNMGGTVSGGYNNIYDDASNVALSSPVIGDPLFINLATSNLHIQNGSPAHNAGDPATSATIDEDIDGQFRPQGAVIDVGADEYYPDFAAFTLTPAFTSNFVDRASVATYAHLLENVGTANDSYTFQCDNNLNWVVACPAGTSLNIGEQITVETDITIPNVAAYTVATTYITATSVFSPAVQHLAVVESVVAPLPGLTFTPTYSAALKPKEVMTFTHWLTNTGDADDTFDVRLVDDTYGWAELVPTNSYSTTVLAPGNGVEVLVVVTVPPNAPAGLANIATIQASSGFDPSVSALVSDTVTAKATIGTRYVAPGGNDLNNNCLVPETPCATIARGVGQASTGDEIRLAAGVYGEANININDLVLISGGWQSNFSVQGDPSDTEIDATGLNSRIFTIAAGSNIRPVISNLTLSNAGTPAIFGGAVLVSNFAQPTFQQVIFTDNNGSQGGALYLNLGTLVVIEKSQFVGNNAQNSGGAIYIAGGSLTLSQNQFRDNNSNGTTAERGGGAVFVSSGLVVAENNLFEANQAANHGGAWRAESGNYTLNFNTFVNNSANNNGGAIYNNGATIAAENSILVNNDAAQGGAIYQAAGATSLTFSNVWGNTTPELGGGVATANLIAADPDFGDSDYRLLPGSPAIDAGNPNAVLAVDFEDDFRPSDQGYDMGYDELAGCRAKRGEAIFGSIQDAVDFITTTTTIQVTGICRGVHPLTVGPNTISQTVHLIDQPLTIQGGWNGDFSEFTGQSTYVDPEGRGRAFYLSGNISVTLEHLIVMNGDATGLGGGPAGEDAGGNFYNLNSPAILRHLTILSGTATLGGGLYNHLGSAYVTFSDYVPGEGEAEGSDSHTQFSNNQANLGGAVYNYNGAMTLDGVVVRLNSATSGGGVYNQIGGLRLINSVLAENNATNGGGLYNQSSSSALFLHLTLYGNEATQNGGGIYNAGGSPPIRSSIFQSNQASSGPAVFIAGGVPTVDYNYYHDHASTPVVGGSQGSHSVNSITAPGLVDPAGGDYYLMDGGAAADIADPNSAVRHDWEADPRPSNQGFDMGADEIAGCLARVDGVIYGSIQVAIEQADPNDQIDVAGRCIGVHPYDAGGSLGVISQTVHITKNVFLLGGWDDTFSQRDAQTILDAVDRGRVIYVAPAITATIKDFTIRGGNALAGGMNGNGGAIYLNNATVTLAGNHVYSNTATNGSAVYLFNSPALLGDGNHFYENEANNGTIYVNNNGVVATIQNNFIYSNLATNGAGIYNAAGNNGYWHNDILTNTASATGGGLYIAAGAPQIRNNLVISNTATNTGGAFGAVGSSPGLSYNDFFGNRNGNWGGSIGSGGPGNLSLDPMFIGFPSRIFSITVESPVFDAADPTVPVVTDYEGDIRPSHQAPDMGADEVGGCFARVLAEPDIIYGSVQLAVDQATNGDTVQVDGKCYNVNELQLPNSTVITQSLFLDKSITVDGAWDYKDSVTATLDALLSGRVIYVASGEQVTITNILLSYGDSTGAGLSNSGGGLYNTGDALLSQVWLANNAADNGGGLYNDGNLTISKSKIYSNTAINGGGLYNQTVGAGLTLIQNSRFYGNGATNGGAIYVQEGVLELNASRLYLNSVSGDGAAIYLNNGSNDTVEISNNFIHDNVAGDQGGAIYNANGGSNDRVWHNTIIFNTASGAGAGLFSAAGNLDIRSNIVDRNFGAGLYVVAGTPIINYNNVYGNVPNYGGLASPGANDRSEEPAYVDLLDDNFHLESGSAGEDQADPSLATAVTSDIDGNIRPTNGGPDIGADEISSCLIRVGDQLFGVFQLAIDYAETNNIMLVEVARGECKGVQERNGTDQVGYISEDLTIIGSLLPGSFADPGDYYGNDVGALSTRVNAEGNGRVLYIGPGADPTIKQLALINGNASAGGGDGNGGGIYVASGGSVGLVIDEICQNTAVNGGGYWGHGNSSADITGAGTGSCVVANINPDDEQDIEYLFFDGNTATSGDGGGLYFGAGSDVAIRNYGMEHNTAGGNGGAIYNAGNGYIINGLYYLNEATGNGGGLYNNGNLTLFHNTIRTNTSGGSGGGVYNSSVNFELNSAVVFENTAGSGTGGLHSTSGGVSLDYNDFYNNTPGDSNVATGAHSFSANPLITPYYPHINSPLIDVADPDLLNPPWEIDYDAGNWTRPDGNPNHNGLHGKGSDIGAVEYLKDFGCAVAPSSAIIDALPGQVVTYSVLITNTGAVWPPQANIPWHGYTDTITVTLASQSFGWSTLEGGPLQSFVLPWKGDVQRVLTITVPLTVTSGTQDITKIQCQSAALLTASNSGSFYTNIGPVTSIEVTPDNTDTALPGDVLTYTHQVKNSGNQAVTVEVIANSGPRHANAVLVDGNGNIITPTVALGPNETYDVLLRVQIFSTGAAGDIATPGVVARSVEDPTNFGAAIDQITIGYTSGTRYVSGNDGVDATNCTDPINPCATIQYAVDQAVDGDTILVASGRYTDHITQTVGLNVFDQNIFINKSLTIRGGYDAADPFTVSEPITNAVILDGEGARRVFYIADGITVTLNSLFIQGGYAYPVFGSPEPEYGGGIYNIGANLTITGSWLILNGAQYGGGLYHAAGNLTIQSSVFVSNTNQPNPANVYGEGGAVYIASGEALLENNSFVYNSAHDISSEAGTTGNGGAVYQESGLLTLRNNIFAFNEGELGSAVFISDTVTVDEDYSLWFDNVGVVTNFATSPNSFTGDPRFIDDFYHIGPDSAAKDRGTSAISIVNGVDFELEPRKQGAEVDLGADERLQQPSFSLTPAGYNTTIDPNQVAVFVHVLQNTGDVTDTYQLVMSNEAIPAGGSWGYSLTPTTITDLGLGQSVTVTLVVTGTSLGGSLNTTTITATADSTASVRTVSDITRISQTPGVTIGIDQNGNANAGSTITYTHTLTNSGDGVDEFILAVDSAVPADWVVTITPTSTGLLLPHETIQFSVAVEVPAGTSGGTVHTVVIRADAFDPDASDTLTDQTTVNTAYNVALEPNNSDTAQPGDTVTYQHILTNTGNIADSYSLVAVSNQGWTVSLNQQTVSLQPGESQNLIVEVTVPAGAAGQIDVTTVTADSDNSTAQDSATNTTTVTSAAGVSLEPDHFEIVPAGTTLIYEHTLTNEGNQSDSFTMTATTSMGWLVSYAPHNVTLAAGGTATILVTVTVPAGADPGQEDETVLTATSLNNPLVNDEATDTTRVAQSHGLTLLPATQSQTVPPDTVVEYVHTLTNTGNGQDTFTFAGNSSQNWDYQLPADVTLDPNQSLNVTFTITVPAGASNGQTDLFNVTASSVISPAFSASVTDTTVVTSTKQTAGVIIAPNRTGNGEPGTTVTYQHTVTNTGTANDSFDLTALSNQGWTVIMTPTTTPNLAPQASTIVVVAITIPAGAISGTIDSTTVTATSNNDPTVVDTATDTTTVLKNIVRGVNIEPSRIGEGSPGSTVTYQHTVTNTGNVTDTFNITLQSSQGWTVSTNRPSVTLGVGDSTSINVMVEIPAGATPGTSDLTIVRAESAQEPTANDSVNDQTTVGEIILYLPILFKPGTPPPGPTPTPTATISPTPCAPTNIDLVVTQIIIQPTNPIGGETALVYVTVKNQGTTNVPYGNNFYLDFYVDDSPSPEEPGQLYWGLQGADFPAGASHTYSKPYIFSGGNHQLWAQVDTDNTVNECPNEGNNIFGPVNLNVGGLGNSDDAIQPIDPPAGPRHTPTPVPAGDLDTIGTPEVIQPEETPLPQTP